MDLREVRELAMKYTPVQIEECITTQIETGQNVCVRNESTEKIISELSEAEFVRNMMDDGMSLADAIRELARRMRQVRKGSEP